MAAARVSMLSEGAAVAPLSLLDQVSWAMDRPARPLDFAVAVTLAAPFDPAALARGAASALLRYPVSGCVTGGRSWRWRGGDVVVPGDSAAALAGTLDLARAPPVRVAVAPGAAGTQLLTARFHHAATDGMGATLWLAHLLAVAAGALAPVTRRVPPEDLPLRRHPRPARRNRFAPRGPSTPLVPGAGPPRGVRAFLTRRLERRAHARPNESAALAAAFLHALTSWRQARFPGAPPGRLGLWLPVDLRRRARAGFGNAVGRIRVHADPGETSAAAVARGLATRVAWSLRHGEWALPTTAPLPLPGWLLRPVVRSYAGRPGVDMGSAAFTHVPRSGLDDVGGIAALACIGPLARQHPIALNCLGYGGAIFATFTFDPAQLAAAEAAAIADRTVAGWAEITGAEAAA